MKYKIVTDSSCEFPVEWRNDPRFERVALGLEVDGNIYMDDDQVDQKEFMDRVSRADSLPSSFCPTAQAYAKAFDCDADTILVFTLSSKISASFESAVAGRRIALDKLKEAGLPKKKIFICDSKSASVGETKLVMKAVELCEQDTAYKDICLKLMFLCNQMKTYFVPNSLDALKKSGRLKSTEPFIGKALNVKPLLCGMDGEIAKLDQGVGKKKAIGKLVEQMLSDIKTPEKKTIIISHCNALDTANEIKQMILSKIKGVTVIIMDATGVSSFYASQGSVIVAV